MWFWNANIGVCEVYSDSLCPICGSRLEHLWRYPYVFIKILYTPRRTGLNTACIRFNSPKTNGWNNVGTVRNARRELPAQVHGTINYNKVKYALVNNGMSTSRSGSTISPQWAEFNSLTARLKHKVWQNDNITTRDRTYLSIHQIKTRSGRIHLFSWFKQSHEYISKSSCGLSADKLISCSSFQCSASGSTLLDLYQTTRNMVLSVAYCS